MAPGPHPRRELTPMPRLRSARRLGMAAGAPTPDTLFAKSLSSELSVPGRARPRFRRRRRRHARARGAARLTGLPCGARGRRDRAGRLRDLRVEERPLVVVVEAVVQADRLRRALADDADEAALRHCPLRAARSRPWAV